MKKIFISSDHAGYNLKEQIKKKFKYKYNFYDLGTNSPKISVNYRVIKDNAEIETKDRNQKSNWAEYNDDWNKNFSDW